MSCMLYKDGYDQLVTQELSASSIANIKKHGFIIQFENKSLIISLFNHII